MSTEKSKKTPSQNESDQVATPEDIDYSQSSYPGDDYWKAKELNIPPDKTITVNRNNST